MFTKLFNLSSNTLKDTFSNIVGKVGEIQNQRKLTEARDIIWFLKSGYE